jgi:hypothetical protein
MPDLSLNSPERSGLEAISGHLPGRVISIHNTFLLTLQNPSKLDKVSFLFFDPALASCFQIRSLRLLTLAFQEEPVSYIARIKVESDDRSRRVEANRGSALTGPGAGAGSIERGDGTVRSSHETTQDVA